MTTRRELTAVHAILVRAHIAAEPCDAKAAFILLNSIKESLDGAAPGFIDSACWR